ncbi:DEAD/DEAH box helicase [Brevibacillus laterosporus]|uniref:DEAD/DEAH box helicase n=1 Tax=Brevibacillus laterosporus TaxID=1465 RepID=UPI002E20B933|nr:DEAD/DEAH box helicase [Brevibacillus laterosporus]
MAKFEQFGLRPEIMQGISDLFYKEPTAIQEEAIPLIMEGKDVIGQAQTGTGKTAAFVLPILQKLQDGKKDIQTLILTPTRELSIQIAAEIEKLGKHLNVSVLSLHGGTDIERQMNKLKGTVHIVVGTPGRVLDHMRRETLHFGRIHTLVLDEADKMLEMGFLEDVEKIIVSTPSSRQVLLFSATMPDLVKKLGQRFMNQPPHIKIESKQKTVANITQEYYVINQTDKIDALLDLIEVTKPFLGIIFANTQQRVKILTSRLQEAGYDAKALYGDLSQKKRETLMKDFRKMKFQFLVATDIAARGLDVEGVTHVFNYDIPSDVESYIHRVGRTGRANQLGNSISFVTPRQKSVMARFGSATKADIEEKLLTHTRHLDAGRKARAAEREKHYTELKTEKKKQEQIEIAEKEAPLKKALVKNKQVKPGYKRKLKREMEEWKTQYERNQKREEGKKSAKANKGKAKGRSGGQSSAGRPGQAPSRPGQAPNRPGQAPSRPGKRFSK